MAKEISDGPNPADKFNRKKIYRKSSDRENIYRVRQSDSAERGSTESADREKIYRQRVQQQSKSAERRSTEKAPTERISVESDDRDRREIIPSELMVPKGT